MVKVKERWGSFIEWHKERLILYKRIGRWIWYGVFLSLVPYLFVLVFNYIVGYNIKTIEMLPDYILVTFAIAVNALSAETDSEKEMADVLRGFTKFISRASLVVCVVFYFGLFNGNYISPHIYAMMEQNTKGITIMHNLFHGILITNIVFGIIVEFNSFGKERKKLLMEKKNGEDSTTE